MTLTGNDSRAANLAAASGAAEDGAVAAAASPPRGRKRRSPRLASAVTTAKALDVDALPRHLYPVGAAVSKLFHVGNEPRDFSGTVVGLGYDDDDAPNYMVKYEDGDEETLGEREVARILVSESKKADQEGTTAATSGLERWRQRKREAAAAKTSSSKRRRRVDINGEPQRRKGDTAAEASNDSASSTHARAEGRQTKWRRTSAGTKTKLCSTLGCNNFAQKAGLCKRHGAPVTPRMCRIPGCPKQEIVGGVCVEHGAKKRIRLKCIVAGCTSGRIQGGLCMRHGAKLPECKVEGCTKRRMQGGKCLEHGAIRKKCIVEGCTNQVMCSKQHVCKKHGAGKGRLCRFAGCTNRVVRNGVCIRHGAKQNRCKQEGCDNAALVGGVCWRHGAKFHRDRCRVEGCNSYALKQKGFCKSHQNAKVP